jgi:hypothetical protein
MPFRQSSIEDSNSLPQATQLLVGSRQADNPEMHAARMLHGVDSNARFTLHT